MYRLASAGLVLICASCWAQQAEDRGAASMGQSEPQWLTSGEFAWQASPPLFRPDERIDDRQFSVKDPTVVRFEGQWHVFYTVRREKRTHSIEYVSFTDWPQMNSAKRHVLRCREGFFCAPQVFYFRPHRKWYLIYQVTEQDRKPGLQPAFSTTEDIGDPSSWTPAELIFPEGPKGVSKWIDFWVICDDARAYLFFTSLDGHLWRMSTLLSEFPHGFGDLQLALRADIFEAAHIYRLEGQNQYLAIIEAITRKPPSGRRYYVAYLADCLDGEWRPLAPSQDKPFASAANLEQPSGRWTGNISHGELLRASYDETLTVDPASMTLLFQGVAAEAAAGKPYGQIPWRLGLLTLRNH